MPRLSLLDMTQSILSAMDSDEVNSIDDTVEAIQVADIIRESFYEIMAERDWPFLYQVVAFTGLGDLNEPTKMQMPVELSKIEWVKYNKKDVKYLNPSSFDDIITKREEIPNIVSSAGFILNRDPIYYTSYDEKYIYFDAIDKTADDTLQTSKCKVYSVVSPTWVHEDSFVPDIPEKMFTTLLSEAKSQAFVNLKQQVNAREERKAQKGRIRLQSESFRIDDAEFKYNRKVNYGRK